MLKDSQKLTELRRPIAVFLIFKYIPGAKMFSEYVNKSN